MRWFLLTFSGIVKKFLLPFLYTKNKSLVTGKGTVNFCNGNTTPRTNYDLHNTDSEVHNLKRLIDEQITEWQHLRFTKCTKFLIYTTGHAEIKFNKIVRNSRNSTFNEIFSRSKITKMS